MEVVSTDNAPAAIGPYAQAVKAGGFLFCSGQIALTPEGDLLNGDVSQQAKQVMNNLSAVLSAAGTDFSRVVKTTIFLADMNDFLVVNDVYAAYFDSENKPARATVEVSRLPKDVLVEIDCIAEL